MSEEKIKIIVVGANGRMGRAILNAIAYNPVFEAGGAVDLQPVALPAGIKCPTGTSLAQVVAMGADGVVIDFTAPDASVATAREAARLDKKMVVGTTGLSREQKNELRELATKTPILWSANMSVGVNVLLRFLPRIAAALGPAYDMEIVETHHRRKKDAPSGTALALAEALAAARDWSLDEVRRSGRDGAVGERPDKEIGVMALRGGDVAGVHDCYFFGPGEIIEIKHTAESRDNFAQGALRAAAWLQTQQPGPLYSMLDALETPGESAPE